MMKMNRAALNEAAKHLPDGRISRERLLAAASRVRMPTAAEVRAAMPKGPTDGERVAEMLRQEAQRPKLGLMKSDLQEPLAVVVLSEAAARARLIKTAAEAFCR